MVGDPFRATTEQAYQVPCRKCGALPFNPCVYTELPNMPIVVRSPQVLRRLALVGKPTQRPHNERYVLAWQRLVRKTKRDNYRQLTEGARRRAATRTQIDVARAHQEYDRREWHQLVLWFRKWGKIFWE